MRIAIFTDSYKPDWNGVAVVVDNLRKGLERAGHEVYVFAPSSRKIKDKNKDENVIYFSSASFKKYPNFRIALFPFVSAVEKAKKLGIEIVHNHAIATMGLASIQVVKKLNIKGISTFHYLSYLKGNFADLAKRYMEWFYSHFSRVIFPSKFAVKESNLLIQNKHYLPNPIDEFYSKPVGKRRIYDFIYAGRMSKRKNLELIIDNAQNIRNVAKKSITFVMAGEGGNKQFLEERAYIKKVSDYFLWTGMLSKKGLRELYWKSKTFLFPSLTDTQGIAVLEAMSAGVIPVVSSSSCMKELVEDGKNGYVFEEELDFYKKAVASLQAKKEMRENARKTASSFFLKNLIPRYVELYESLLRY